MTDAVAFTDRSTGATAQRVIFRLHFYAGLIVAPFILILAFTGAIYLFNTEIEDAIHPDWTLTQAAGPHLPADRLADAAVARFPGSRPTRIDLPTTPNHTAVVFLTPQQGDPFRAYVDPVTAEMKGSFVYEKTLVGWADAFHGSLALGKTGDAIVELAACWAILLTVTGLYLWWPRSGRGAGGVVYPRLYLKGRAFWRDIHAVTGVAVSALLLFLLITGLPWAGIWGNNLNRAMAAVGLGYPASYRTHISGLTSDEHANHHPATLQQTNKGIPWSLEQAPAPMSHEGHATAPISAADAVRIYAGAGLASGYRLIYPRNARDVFTAYTYPDQPEGQRTIHLDQYTGQVINDVRFSDYGAGAQAIELGVQLHMGNYFGLANQIIMLLAAVGAALLSATGPLMWLKRRRKGLGAPSALDQRAGWPVYVLLIGFAVLFPLLGATALVVLLVERFVLARFTSVRNWLGLSSQDHLLARRKI